MTVFLSPIRDLIQWTDQAIPVRGPICNFAGSIFSHVPVLGEYTIWMRNLQGRLNANFKAAQQQQIEETRKFDMTVYSKTKFSVEAEVRPQTPVEEDPHPVGVSVTIKYTSVIFSEDKEHKLADYVVQRALLKNESKNLGEIPVGICAWNVEREDGLEFSLAEDLNVTIDNIDYAFKVFGLFEAVRDGDNELKGGAARIMSESVVAQLKAAIEKNNLAGITEQGIWNSLTDCFSALTDLLVKNPAVNGQYSTAAVALLIDDKVWCANIGRTRIVLNNNGTAVQLTKDAPAETIPSRRSGFALYNPFHVYFARESRPVITCYSLPSKEMENKNCHLLLCSYKVFMKNHSHSYYKLTAARIAKGAFLLEQKGRSCADIAATLAAYPLPSCFYEGELTVMVAKV